MAACGVLGVTIRATPSAPTPRRPPSRRRTALDVSALAWRLPSSSSAPRRMVAPSCLTPCGSGSASSAPCRSRSRVVVSGCRSSGCCSRWSRSARSIPVASSRPNAGSRSAPSFRACRTWRCSSSTGRWITCSKRTTRFSVTCSGAFGTSSTWKSTCCSSTPPARASRSRARTPTTMRTRRVKGTTPLGWGPTARSSLTPRPNVNAAVCASAHGRARTRVPISPRR